MRLSDRAKFYVAATAVLTVTFAAGPALADGGLDRITNLYRDNANAWGPSLRNYAIGLFGMLALLEFVWSFTRLAIKGADVGEFLSEFVTRMMFVLFFYWLMIASAEIAPAIVKSFQQAGSTAAQAGGGSGGMRPSDIWTAGVNMATRIMQTDVGVDVGKALALIIAALVLIVCFALMAAAMIIALVEGYIVMNAGVLMMGFGGSRWTKDIAIKTLQYAVSVGAKLFVIQILVGMAEAMVKGWTGDLGTGAGVSNMEQILEIIGASIVMLALTFTIPGILQGVINGTSQSSSSSVTGAAAAVGGAIAGGIGAAVGGGMAIGGASKLASEQLKAADAAGTAPSGAMARAAAIAGGTFANLGTAANADIGNVLSGRARAGTPGGRMGASMEDTANRMQKERLRAAAPMTAEPQPEAVMAGGGGEGEAASASAAATGPDAATGGGSSDSAADAAGTIRPEGGSGGSSRGEQSAAKGQARSPFGSDEPIRGAAPPPEPVLSAPNGASGQTANAGEAPANKPAGKSVGVSPTSDDGTGGMNTAPIEGAGATSEVTESEPNQSRPPRPVGAGGTESNADRSGAQTVQGAPPSATVSPNAQGATGADSPSPSTIQGAASAAAATSDGPGPKGTATGPSAPANGAVADISSVSREIPGAARTPKEPGGQ